jgi:hypothetical protein
MEFVLWTALCESAPSSVFNQYVSVQPDLDVPNGAERRLANLRRYMEIFAEPRYVLIGEAAGYGGCRFSGLPFTDETQLAGRERLDWAGLRYGFQRSSREDRPLSREASARAVWRALGGRRDVALWNVVPWHPPGPRGPLSNRRPNGIALKAGLAVLRLVLKEIWPQAEPRAVGRLAEEALHELGIAEPVYLRHPSQGGIGAFRAGLQTHCPT